jgi:hypothetical protein
MRPLTAEAGKADSVTIEHIFPESLFGVVKTKECCATCNSSLGHKVDKRLLADERIVLAAREAGVKEGELLARFTGNGLDSLSRPAQYTVKNGQWRLEPNFHPQGFRIGMIEDRILPQDLENAKGKMYALVRADKTLLLSPEETAEHVDKLFDTFLAKSGKEAIYSDKINQGLRGIAGPTHIKLDGENKPYETEWAIAKIAYETGILLLPPGLFAKVWSALDQLKRFVLQQEVGKSVFSYEPSMTAERWHSVNLSAGADSICFDVTLFGKATWRLAFTVLEKGVPARLDGFNLTLRNDFPEDVCASAKVFRSDRIE